MYYKVTAYIHYHRYMTVLLLEQLNISKCTVSTPVQRGIPLGDVKLYNTTLPLSGRVYFFV